MMFLTVLFFIFIGLWLLGLLFRWLLPLWLMRMQKKFYNNMNNQTGQGFGSFGQRSYGQKTTTRPEGEVVVETTDPQAKKKIDKSLGDYVEFEEEK